MWTVPEAHMKRYCPHRVPLSAGALAVLDEARGLHGDGEFAFRGAQGGKLSRTAVADALRKAEVNATGHGFRSSFKDWRGTREWTRSSRSLPGARRGFQDGWPPTRATTCWSG